MAVWVSWLFKKNFLVTRDVKSMMSRIIKVGVLLGNLKLIRNLLSVYLKRIGVGLLELLSLDLPWLIS